MAQCRRAVPTGNKMPTVPSKSAAIKQQQQQQQQPPKQQQRPTMATEPKDIIAALPFTLLPVSLDASISDVVDEKLTEEYTFSRLIELAQRYLAPAQQSGTSSANPTSHRDWSSMYKSDLTSATFYAWLALQHTPTSLLARRLLATCLIHGGEPFPYGPGHAIGSTRLTLTSVSSTAAAATSTAERAGARAAIELFQQGPDYVYRDVECAQVYAHACSVVGRVKGGKAALEWAHKAANEPSSVEKKKKDSLTVEAIHSRPSVGAKAPQEASPISELALADMAAKGQEHVEARAHYRACRKLDPWCWAAWAGICDNRNDVHVDQEAEDAVDPADGKDVDGFVPADIVDFQTEFSAKLLYPDMLKQALLKRDIDPVLVQCILDSLLVSHGGEPKTPSPKAAVVEEIKAEKKAPLNATNAKVNAKGDAPSAIPRPGSRIATGPAAVVGTKRMRTEPQTANGNAKVQARQTSIRATSVSTSAPVRTNTVAAAKPSTATRTTTRTTTRPAAATTTTRPTTATTTTRPTTGATTKRPAAAAATTTTTTTRTTTRPATTTTTTTTTKAAGTFGTLSTAKQNEQRPASQASSSSGSDRSSRTTGKDSDKLRRSPRVPSSASSTTASRTTRPTATAATATTTVKRPVAGQQGSTVRPATLSTSTVPRQVAPKVMPVPRVRLPSSSSSAVSQPAGVQHSSQQQQPRKLSVELDLMERIQAAVYEAAEMAIKESSQWHAADGRVKDLFLTFAGAYKALRAYRSRQAIANLRPKGPMSALVKKDFEEEVDLYYFAPAGPVLSGLEDRYRNSYYVQSLLGRAYHDAVNYKMAEKHFAHAANLSPIRLNHMDIYSLTLFHLQREVELSALVQRLKRIDASSCVTQIAQGNVFALQHEHHQAFKCFRKAVCAAPEYAHAYTLAGYEALELRNNKIALEYLNLALTYDRRHWNAYAAIGWQHAIKHDHKLALQYYMNALKINEQSASLWNLAGTALQNLDRLLGATGAFCQALKANYQHAGANFKLAEVLNLRADLMPPSQEKQIGDFRERAHSYLLAAVEYAPQDADAHLSLAKSFMRKGGGAFAVVESGKSSSVRGAQQMVRAVGDSTLPFAHQDAITHHLCAAVENDPRLLRKVKAMGEGVRALLRGAANRLAGTTGGVQQHESFATTIDNANDTYGNTMGTSNYVHEDSMQMATTSMGSTGIEEDDERGEGSRGARRDGADDLDNGGGNDGDNDEDADNEEDEDEGGENGSARTRNEADEGGRDPAERDGEDSNMSFV